MSGKADILLAAIQDADDGKPLTQQKALQLVCGIARLETADLPPNVRSMLETSRAFLAASVSVLPDERNLRDD